jgi:hypothetical protein
MGCGGMGGMGQIGSPSPSSFVLSLKDLLKLVLLRDIKDIYTYI